MEKASRENIAKHLLEYQLNMVDKELIHTMDDDAWRFNITMTTLQRFEFKKYAIGLIQKLFKVNKTKATKTYEDFIKDFGLRIKN